MRRRTPQAAPRSRGRPLPLLAALLVLLLVGCAADPDPDLIDNDGVVEDATFHFSVPDEQVLAHLDDPVDVSAVAVDPPEGVDVRIVWTGLPCHLAPTVHVDRDHDHLVVAVERGPQVTGVGQECPSVEDLHAVDLTLDPDATIQEVEVTSR